MLLFYLYKITADASANWAATQAFAEQTSIAATDLTNKLKNDFKNKSEELTKYTTDNVELVDFFFPTIFFFLILNFVL